MAEPQTFSSSVDSAQPALDEVVVTARRAPTDLEKVFNTGGDFLKTSRFEVFFNIPEFLKGFGSAGKPYTAEEMFFTCDAIEFPGATLTTTDYRIPGDVRRKISYMRDVSDVTFSLYYSKNLQTYPLFFDWIRETSRSTAYNRYYKEIVTDMRIKQYTSTDETALVATLINAYPTIVPSIPANWADEGFQKVSVSFTFERVVFSS